MPSVSPFFTVNEMSLRAVRLKLGRKSPAALAHQTDHFALGYAEIDMVDCMHCAFLDAGAQQISQFGCEIQTPDKALGDLVQFQHWCVHTPLSAGLSGRASNG
jgi:hypothetical protein